MGVAEILAAVDREIALLQKARELLGGASAAAPRAGRKAARPRKAVAAVQHAAAKPAMKRRKKRHLSAEGRKRIIEAVKRRWAAQKKAAGK